MTTEQKMPLFAIKNLALRGIEATAMRDSAILKCKAILQSVSKAKDNSGPENADTATRVSANPQPRSHLAGLLRSERQLLATAARESAIPKAKPCRRACRRQDNPMPFNDSDPALRDSAFLHTGGKLQVMTERQDNFRKDDDVRWQCGSRSA